MTRSYHEMHTCLYICNFSDVTTFPSLLSIIVTILIFLTPALCLLIILTAITFLLQFYPSPTRKSH